MFTHIILLMMGVPALENWWMPPSKTECQALLLLIMKTSNKSSRSIIQTKSISIVSSSASRYITIILLIMNFSQTSATSWRRSLFSLHHNSFDYGKSREI